MFPELLSTFITADSVGKSCCSRDKLVTDFASKAPLSEQDHEHLSSPPSLYLSHLMKVDDENYESRIFFNDRHFEPIMLITPGRVNTPARVP